MHDERENRKLKKENVREFDTFDTRNDFYIKLLRMHFNYIIL